MQGLLNQDETYYQSFYTKGIADPSFLCGGCELIINEADWCSLPILRNIMCSCVFFVGRTQ